MKQFLFPDVFLIFLVTAKLIALEITHYKKLQVHHIARHKL